MRKLVIQNDTVVNVIEVEDDSFTLDGCELLLDKNQAFIGWSRVGGVFTAPAPQPEPVPQSITPLQARKALRALGLHAQVTAYVATLSEEEQEAWEYCISVERQDGLVVTAATLLGMTSTQIDDLFRLGKTFN
jgi:hypothetical protein